MLLTKTKLNSIAVLISITLIDLYINQDECISVNKMLRKFNEIKGKVKNPKYSLEYSLLNGWFK